jgi:hypothetical protein
MRKSFSKSDKWSNSMLVTIANDVCATIDGIPFRSSHASRKFWPTDVFTYLIFGNELWMKHNWGENMIYSWLLC